MKRSTIERAGIAVTIVAISTIGVGWRARPFGTARLDASRATTTDTSSRSPAMIQVSMRNVNFYVRPNAALHIRHLRGVMRPLNGEAIVFDDRKSFVIGMAHAEIGLSGPDLSTLLNTIVFAYRGAPHSVAPAFMYYKGGTLRFGKLLMADAEMQIVGLDKNEFFGFDLDRYKQRLVAGYSRTLPSFGLEVYMASAETLRGRSAAAAPDEKTLEARRVTLSRELSYNQER